MTKESSKSTLESQVLLFPSTRYQGSKRKLLPWLWNNLKDLSFNSVLDPFGGTGSVSYLFKSAGKQIIYNDVLNFNSVIGNSLIANDNVKLTHCDINFILKKNPNIKYDDFIERTFNEIYFTQKENKWLDQIIQNIKLLNNSTKKAIALFAVFQAALSKRPFNLFHRKNLYLRFADVKRSFGNKKTWDKSFESHFLKSVDEINSAIFSNGKKCEYIKYNIFDIPTEFCKTDLVYLDPPYMDQAGKSTDYLNYYHFLEGLCSYSNWLNKIDFTTKNLRFNKVNFEWNKKKYIYQNFTDAINKFSKSIIAISYRNDGIPSISELVKMTKQVKKHVEVFTMSNFQYVLSKNKNSKEILIVGTD